MAITRTAKGTRQGKTGFSASIPFGVTSIGDLIVFVIATELGSGGGAVTKRYRYNGTDEDTGTWELDASGNNAPNVVVDIYRHIVEIPGTFASDLFIDATVDARPVAVAAMHIAGVSAAPFDKASTGVGSSLAATSGATSTTAQADEILIGGIGWEGPDGDDAGTWQNSFNAGQRLGTTGGGAASNITVQEGFLIVAATDAYTAAVTRTANSRDWAAVIATYKGSSFNPGVLGLKHVGNPNYSAITQLIQA
jgi:hypothetical protein